MGEEPPRVPLGTAERVSGLTGRSGSLDEALAELKSREGSVFDPAVVASLAAVHAGTGGTVSHTNARTRAA